MKRFLAPFALGVLFLAGCGGGSDHNAQDVTSPKDMVPHHQQAVEMADLADSRAADPRVRDIAARIKAEEGKYQPAKDLARAIQDTQVKEVAEMQQILGALPAS